MARNVLIRLQPNLAMKTEKNLQIQGASRNNTLTFGDFVADVYEACGNRRAGGIVKFAVAAHLIEFRDTRLTAFCRGNHKQH